MKKNKKVQDELRPIGSTVNEMIGYLSQYPGDAIVTNPAPYTLEFEPNPNSTVEPNLEPCNCDNHQVLSNMPDLYPNHNAEDQAFNNYIKEKLIGISAELVNSISDLHAEIQEYNNYKMAKFTLNMCTVVKGDDN